MKPKPGLRSDILCRIMGFFPRRFRRLDEAADGLLARRPRLASGLSRYGFLLLAAFAAFFVAVGAAFPVGRGQEIVYATGEGDVVATQPATGERTPIHVSDGLATAPLLNGGSRNLSYTVLRDGEFRGDLYGADLARGTRALTRTATAGEVFVHGGYSNDREWLLASRYSDDARPNVVALTASGATMQPVEPGPADSPAILGPSWTGLNSLYAWRKNGGGLSLTAYNFFEERQAVVYETENRVGLPSYNFESNTIVFDERPVGADLEESRLTAIAGTAEVEVSGTEGLGVYDPSIPVPELDYDMAVIWTNGDESGVGLFDPSDWTFEKTGVMMERGSRHPQLSYDGTYVATANDEGNTITVRRMDDGSVVRRIEGAQPPDVALAKMREAGLTVPEEAGWLAPPNFTWRSFEDS
ncbi:MAG: hypothetical protein ACRDSJ_08535 [Rubrobacteraceae bacterium]